MARSRPLSAAPRGVNRAANKAADPAPMSLLLADAGARPAELRRPADIAAQLIEQAQALLGPQRMPWGWKSSKATTSLPLYLPAGETRSRSCWP